MSVANEIERIQRAKVGLKAAIESRGGVVSEDATIDGYCEILNSRPYASKGNFTPEADTRSFSINGLPFKPKIIYIYCHDLYINPVAESFVCYGKGKNIMGILASNDNNGTTTSMIIKNITTVETWSDSGYEINLPSSIPPMKAGYTYEYYIAGGYSE